MFPILVNEEWLTPGETYPGGAVGGITVTDLLPTSSIMWLQNRALSIPEEYLIAAGFTGAELAKIKSGSNITYVEANKMLSKLNLAEQFMRLKQGGVSQTTQSAQTDKFYTYLLIGIVAVLVVVLLLR